MDLPGTESRSGLLFVSPRRRGPARDLAGLLLLATVSLLLWSWFAVAVVSPLARVRTGAPAEEPTAGPGVELTLVQAPSLADGP